MTTTNNTNAAAHLLSHMSEQFLERRMTSIFGIDSRTLRSDDEEETNVIVKAADNTTMGLYLVHITCKRWSARGTQLTNCTMSVHVLAEDENGAEAQAGCAVLETDELKIESTSAHKVPLMIRGWGSSTF